MLMSFRTKDQDFENPLIELIFFITLMLNNNTRNTAKKVVVPMCKGYSKDSGENGVCLVGIRLG